MLWYLRISSYEIHAFDPCGSVIIFWARFNCRNEMLLRVGLSKFRLLTSKESESTGRATVAMATSCCLAFVASCWRQQLRSSWWPCRSNHTMKPRRLRHDLSQVLGPCGVDDSDRNMENTKKMRQVSQEVEWSHYMEQLLDQARSRIRPPKSKMKSTQGYKLAVFYVPWS